MSKIDNLEEIKFQFKKPFIIKYGDSNPISEPLPVYSDPDLVYIVQSLADAQIDPGDVVDDISKLPQNMLGVSMDWQVGGNVCTMKRGAIELVDNFADHFKPLIPVDEGNYLSIAGELFVLSSGENLLLNLA